MIRPQPTSQPPLVAFRPDEYGTDRYPDFEDLFRRVVEGDDYLAFEGIFKRTYKGLCSYAGQIVKSRELAEEIVDDVFCNLWKNRKKIQISSSFRSYLVASVRNKSLDCLRKLKSRKNSVFETSMDIPSGQSIAWEAMVYEELSQKVDAAIAALPRQCRTIFMMSRDQNLKYKEIADILHISIKTVDTQMGRALKSLRKSIMPGSF